MDLVDKIRDRTEKLFSGSNGSHDWEHTMRVYNLCMHIGEKVVGFFLNHPFWYQKHHFKPQKRDYFSIHPQLSSVHRGPTPVRPEDVNW